MLNLTKKNVEEFEIVYNDMCLQFPKSEMKEYAKFCSLLKNNEYKLLCASENDITTGYVILYEDKENQTVWLDYIAVFKEFHSLGYGTRIFEALKSYYKNFEGIYLEVEKPDEKEINTLRRIKFYTSLGAKKLDINYFYPNEEGCISMDLYFLPLKSKEAPNLNETMICVKSAFKSLHSDISHLDEVLRRIN